MFQDSEMLTPIIEESYWLTWIYFDHLELVLQIIKYFTFQQYVFILSENIYTFN